MKSHYPAEYWIENLKMKAHPEGGYWADAFRSNEVLKKEALPSQFDADRNLYSSIYFLLPGNSFSALHRLKADEIWHFYAGCSLSLYVINANGFVTVRQLGDDYELQESLQIMVPAGCWFAAKPTLPESYTLAGCTMAPGFDFKDWELADREDLITKFPQHEKLILSFTR